LIERYGFSVDLKGLAQGACSRCGAAISICMK
jgi:hypothetical protein